VNADPTGAAAATGLSWVKMSGRSWRWSAMYSNARWPSGSRTQWAVAVAALIAAQRDQHQIPHAVACRALGVSRSWFYQHKAGRLSPRAARREALAAGVRRCVQAYLCTRLYVGNVGGNRQFTLVVNIRGAPSRREYPRSTSRRAYLIVDFARRQNDRSVWPGSVRVQGCYAHMTASTCAEGRKFPYWRPAALAWKIW
jgi:hypothetical protein